jgi:hypothetical protein
LYPGEKEGEIYRREAIPMEIDDLFHLQEDIEEQRMPKTSLGKPDGDETSSRGSIVVSDVRKGSKDRPVDPFDRQCSEWSCFPASSGLNDRVANGSSTKVSFELEPLNAEGILLGEEPVLDAVPDERRRAGDPEVADENRTVTPIPSPRMEVSGLVNTLPTISSPTAEDKKKVKLLDGLVRPEVSGGADDYASEKTGLLGVGVIMEESQQEENKNRMHSRESKESFLKLNQIIYTRSKRAQLVVMNLPDLWGTTETDMVKFMYYCDTLTKGLERVLFVHSTGHEVFDIAS